MTGEARDSSKVLFSRREFDDRAVTAHCDQLWATRTAHNGSMATQNWATDRPKPLHLPADRSNPLCKCTISITYNKTVLFTCIHTYVNNIQILDHSIYKLKCLVIDAKDHCTLHYTRV